MKKRLSALLRAVLLLSGISCNIHAEEEDQAKRGAYAELSEEVITEFELP